MEVEEEREREEVEPLGCRKLVVESADEGFSQDGERDGEEGKP